jgi:hypothetical protein
MEHLNRRGEPTTSDVLRSQESTAETLLPADSPQDEPKCESSAIYMVAGLVL